MKTTIILILVLFFLACAEKELDVFCLSEDEKILEVEVSDNSTVLIQEDSCFYTLSVTKSLAKALYEHKTSIEYIKALKRNIQKLEYENNDLRWELQKPRFEYIDVDTVGNDNSFYYYFN